MVNSRSKEFFNWCKLDGELQTPTPAVCPLKRLTWNAKRRALSKWTMKPRAAPEASDRRQVKLLLRNRFSPSARSLSPWLLRRRWKWKLCSAKATTASVCQKTNDWETAPLCASMLFWISGCWYRKARQSRWKHDEKARARIGSDESAFARPLIRAARTGTHTRSAHCHFGEAITKKNLKKNYALQEVE